MLIISTLSLTFILDDPIRSTYTHNHKEYKRDKEVLLKVICDSFYKSSYTIETLNNDSICALNVRNLDYRISDTGINYKGDKITVEIPTLNLEDKNSFEVIISFYGYHPSEPRIYTRFWDSYQISFPMEVPEVDNFYRDSWKYPTIALKKKYRRDRILLNDKKIDDEILVFFSERGFFSKALKCIGKFCTIPGGKKFEDAIELFTTHARNPTLLQSLYFSSVTMLTIGYGDISPSSDIARIFVIIVGFIGFILFGIFITVTYSNIENMLRQSREYLQIQRAISKFNNTFINVNISLCEQGVEVKNGKYIPFKSIENMDLVFNFISILKQTKLALNELDIMFSGDHFDSGIKRKIEQLDMLIEKLLGMSKGEIKIDQESSLKEANTIIEIYNQIYKIHVNSFRIYRGNDIGLIKLKDGSFIV